MKKSVWAALGLTAVWGLVASVSAQTVDKEMLEQDLAYVVETVSEVHPAFVKRGRREALADRAASLLQPLPDEVPRWQVGATVAELLRTLDDGHTQTDLTFGSVGYLPLQFAWLSDGLVVAPVTGADITIPVASEVLKIGELSVSALEDKLAALIPENRYATREGVRNLPAESVLRWLDVVDNDAVRFEVRTPSGETRVVRVNLSGYGLGSSQDLQKQLLEARGLGSWRVMGEVTAWRVDASSDYGLFWLRAFRDVPEYHAEVQSFFEEVAETDVKHIVVSVQQNGGGNSSIMNTFLAHLPARNVQSYAVDIRYSSAALRHNGVTQAQYEEAVRKNQLGADTVHVESDVYRNRSVHEIIPKEDPVFDGKIYVLVDSASFSSAVDMATVLSDNGLVTLVGASTGGMPTSFGDAIEFVTPGLKVPFLVSYKYFVRPDPSRDPADMLAPDIPLPITVKDVQTGHSPVLAWLESLDRSQSAAGQ